MQDAWKWYVMKSILLFYEMSIKKSVNKFNSWYLIAFKYYWMYCVWRQTTEQLFTNDKAVWNGIPLSLSFRMTTNPFHNKPIWSAHIIALLINEWNSLESSSIQSFTAHVSDVHLLIYEFHAIIKFAIKPLEQHLCLNLLAYIRERYQESDRCLNATLLSCTQTNEPNQPINASQTEQQQNNKCLSFKILFGTWIRNRKYSICCHFIFCFYK